MSPENELHFFLGEPGRANFSMSSNNGWWNGISASLATIVDGNFQQAVFQFDDGMVAEMNGMQASEIMLEVLQKRTRKKIPKLTKIPEKEIVWAIDSRCNYPGPARGFLAFQKRMAGDAMNILCMGMKKEQRGSPDEQNLNTPTVLFVPHGQKPVSDEYPTILIPQEQQKAFEYLVGRLYWAQQKAKMPTLGQALDHAENIFLEPFEPESITRIKAVFGIE